MLFLLAFLTFLINSITLAQNADEMRVFKHPLTDMPAPAEDVVTASYFPVHPDHKLPIGEVVTALCHFSNEGSTPYNVSAIMGSLNSPFDFHVHFQNYSYKPFGIVVKPGEEISFKYNFQLHPDLEPVDYQLAITVFYDSEDRGFSTTFFNQTVELYNPNSEYDFETVSSVLMGLISLVAVVLISIYACFPDKKIPVVSGIFAKLNQLELNNLRTLADKTEEDEDWLDDQPAASMTSPKGRRAKKEE